MSKRMTKKELAEIKHACHVGEWNLARNIHVERLVEEVEKLWCERRMGGRRGLVLELAEIYVRRFPNHDHGGDEAVKHFARWVAAKDLGVRRLGT